MAEVTITVPEEYLGELRQAAARKLSHRAEALQELAEGFAWGDGTNDENARLVGLTIDRIKELEEAIDLLGWTDRGSVEDLDVRTTEETAKAVLDEAEGWVRELISAPGEKRGTAEELQGLEHNVACLRWLRSEQEHHFGPVEVAEEVTV